MGISLKTNIGYCFLIEPNPYVIIIMLYWEIGDLNPRTNRMRHLLFFPF